MLTDLVLQVVGLSKSFPGVKALDGVRLAVERGKVHAVLGENGAGKSTLMKILIGLLAPDSGQILLEGARLRLRSPHEALQHGLAMIHQELLPFPHLTVAENIFMGQEPVGTFPGWVDYKKMNEAAGVLLKRLHLDFSPKTRMQELSVAEMQGVEIAKALAHQARIIIMDEPTSALSAREVEGLFEVIRDLKAQGVAILYVSHKLEEIFRIADVVTVLRDGCYIESRPIEQLAANTLIALMVGRAVEAPAAKGPGKQGEVVLAVRGLSRPGQFREITFDLRRGEILGLAGLMGAGRTELLSALYGLAPATGGEIRVRGRLVRIQNPADAMANGLAMVTEDRKKFGLVLPMSVKHNLTLSNLRAYCRAGFIRHAAENRLTHEQVRQFGIKSANQTVEYLSGGNQQKVVLAKALLRKPDILLLDEPTRGIDIGAKAEIYRLITELAREGQAVLLASSELPELLALSARILVMRQGALTAELDPTQTTQEEIMRYAMPVS